MVLVLFWPAAEEVFKKKLELLLVVFNVAEFMKETSWTLSLGFSSKLLLKLTYSV